MLRPYLKYPVGGAVADPKQMEGVEQYTPEAAAEQQTVPVEVEDKEIGIAKDKQGQWTIVFDTGGDAPDHREGGVDMEMPVGTQIFNAEYYDEVKAAVQQGDNRAIEGLIQERDANLKAEGKPTDGMTEQQMQAEFAKEDAQQSEPQQQMSQGQMQMPQQQMAMGEEMPQEETAQMRYGGRLSYRTGGRTGGEDPIYDKRGKRIDKSFISDFQKQQGTNNSMYLDPNTPKFEMPNYPTRQLFDYDVARNTKEEETHNANLPQRTLLSQSLKQPRPLDAGDSPYQQRRNIFDIANQYNPNAIAEQRNQVTIGDNKQYSTPSDEPLNKPTVKDDYLGRDFLTKSQNSYFNQTAATLGLQQLYNVTRPNTKNINPALVKPTFVNADVTPFTEQRAQIGRDSNNMMQNLKGMSQGSDLIAAAGMLNNQTQEGYGKINAGMSQYLNTINQQNSQIANQTDQYNTAEINKFTGINAEMQREDTMRRHKAIEDGTTEQIKNNALRVNTGMQNKAQEANMRIHTGAIELKRIDEENETMKAAVESGNFKFMADVDEDSKKVYDDFNAKQTELFAARNATAKGTPQYNAIDAQITALLKDTALKGTAARLTWAKKAKEQHDSVYSDIKRSAYTREDDKVFNYGRVPLYNR